MTGEKTADRVVLYQSKEDGREYFTAPSTEREAEQQALELERQGHLVLALTTAEYRDIRWSQQDETARGMASGAHLHAFLESVTQAFRHNYPGVKKETALEVTSLLCTLYLEGEKGLQSALMDAIHEGPVVDAKQNWKADMRASIASRTSG